MRAARVLLLVLPALAACAGEPDAPPGTISLATGADPLAALPEHGWTTPDGRALAVRQDEDGTWLEVEVAASDWAASGRPGLLTTPMPVDGLGTPDVRLRGDPRVTSLARLTGPMVREQGEQALAPGQYHPFGGDLFLRWREGEPPPPGTVLGIQLDVSSRGEDGGLLVRGRRFSGAGLVVWPGTRLERDVSSAVPRALRFATCSERLVAGAPDDTRHTFVVRVDGEVALRHEQAHGPDGAAAWHALAIPPGTHRVAFEVEGPLAHTAFLVPTLGPLEVPRYDAPGRAPSVVLFLADTFRADNLALYGGAPGTTPHLDALAQDSLRLLRAWSVGTYTLPGHASMFSGLFPRQAASDALSVALPDQVLTIAEHLRAHGYRTGAVTDSGVVSMRFGLHQGFDWFDEAHQTIDATVARARAFLEQDDGRPVFLFVQTYRAHSPYRAREDAPFAQAAFPEFTEVSRAVDALVRTRPRTPAQERALRERLAALAALYRAGAHDLDRAFGDFLHVLGALGLDEGGALVFTSDHGEAFLEHEQMYHRGKVHEEQVRVPLLVRAPGLLPRTETHAASLVDLPRTIAELAGVPPAPPWLGTSLLALVRDRPVFAFECDRRTDVSTVAIIDGERKLIGLESFTQRQLVEPWRAFDLSVDPRERADLLGVHDWPQALFERYRTIVQPLLVPQFGDQGARLDDASLAELRALGYVEER